MLKIGIIYDVHVHLHVNIIYGVQTLLFANDMFSEKVIPGELIGGRGSYQNHGGRNE